MNQRLSVGNETRVWWADDSDHPWVQYLLKQYRNWEFFYVPDYSLKREISRGNILCCDYNKLEAGYIWATFVERTGRCRFNQVAITEELWRRGVGRKAVLAVEDHARSRGLWSVYLSCNTNTPGHNFWPQLGYTPIMRKPAKYRGGENIVWAKIIEDRQTLFGSLGLSDVKSSYTLQYSMNSGGHNKPKNSQLDLEF